MVTVAEILKSGQWAVERSEGLPTLSCAALCRPVQSAHCVILQHFELVRVPIEARESSLLLSGVLSHCSSARQCRVHSTQHGTAKCHGAWEVPVQKAKIGLHQLGIVLMPIKTL